MSLFESIHHQDAVYSTYGWIQWKGTDVCMDMHCSCGQLGHIDAEFAYFYECVCGKRYAIGSVVKLIELTAEQAIEVTKDFVFMCEQ